MNLRTFSASTMAQALVQVKNEMGNDAVILHTRTYHRRRWLGLRRVEIVEITAGTGLNVRTGARGPRRPQSIEPSPLPPRRPQVSAVVGPGAYQRSRVPGALALSSAAAPALLSPAAPRENLAALPPRNAMEGSRQIMETPAAGNAMMLSLSREMAALKTMVNDLVNETRMRKAPQVPEDLFEYYLKLVENRVAEDLAADLLKTLRAQLRPEHMQQAQYVREKLADLIERMLPSCGPITRRKTFGPHVVVLIGPTGVGKTTTIAKLAANLKLRDKHRVGLITIDTYRIAAVDQIKKFADIIGAALRIVSTPEDLSEAIAAMNDCEFILIDTAGRSPSDTLKLNELKGFIQTANPDEVHLVLSATASEECIERALERFGDVRVDHLIFTKLDEAVHVGVVLNVVRKVNKALSYVTTGQDVPNDIEVGRGRRLAQLMLGGAA